MGAIPLRGGTSGQGSSFISNVAVPALQAVKAKLEKKGRMVAIEHSDNEATLIAIRRGHLEIRYVISVEGNAEDEFPDVTTFFTNSTTGEETRSEPETLKRQGREICVRDATGEDVENDFLYHYRPVIFEPQSEITANDLEEFF